MKHTSYPATGVSCDNCGKKANTRESALEKLNTISLFRNPNSSTGNFLMYSRVFRKKESAGGLSVAGKAAKRLLNNASISRHNSIEVGNMIHCGVKRVFSILVTPIPFIGCHIEVKRKRDVKNTHFTL